MYRDCIHTMLNVLGDCFRVDSYYSHKDLNKQTEVSHPPGSALSPGLKFCLTALKRIQSCENEMLLE